MQIKFLDAKEYAVIAMMYIVLVDLGFMLEPPDPSDTTLVSRCGPHRTFTIALVMRDDTDFPLTEFSDRLFAYSSLSSIQPLACTVEYFPALIPDPSGDVDPVTGTLPSVPLKNFSTAYIEVFM